MFFPLTAPLDVLHHDLRGDRLRGVHPAPAPERAWRWASPASRWWRLVYLTRDSLP
jgi:hypothetical protein